jgi:hypothetical protein
MPPIRRRRTTPATCRRLRLIATGCGATSRRQPCGPPPAAAPAPLPSATLSSCVVAGQQQESEPRLPPQRRHRRGPLRLGLLGCATACMRAVFPLLPLQRCPPLWRRRVHGLRRCMPPAQTAPSTRWSRAAWAMGWGGTPSWLRCWCGENARCALCVMRVRPGHNSASIPPLSPSGAMVAVDGGVNSTEAG